MTTEQTPAESDNSSAASVLSSGDGHAFRPFARGHVKAVIVALAVLLVGTTVLARSSVGVQARRAAIVRTTTVPSVSFPARSDTTTASSVVPAPPAPTPPPTPPVTSPPPPPVTAAQVAVTRTAPTTSPPRPPVTTIAPTTVRALAPPTTSSGYGCAAAISYLEAHADPVFHIECPGYAEGQAAMTCANEAPCPGQYVIAIADPCPAAYMNEANNSYIILGLLSGILDPYGHC